jgi:hypothetical protein
MSTQNNQPKRIDFLTLSDAEKADFIKETRKYLRQQIEEAKFWRTLAENDRILIKGLPAAFEESNLPPFEESNNLNNFS